ADNDPGEVELSLIECQLPYTWFDITIYTLDEYYNVPVRLFQASSESDYTLAKCDSLVVITVNETEVDAHIFESSCTHEGKEYSFAMGGIELQGADYQWIDANTGLDATEISEFPNALLPTGEYFVYVSGYIEDVNHNDNSVGTEPLSYISCDFGPFELFNPVPEKPEVMPYDTFLCPGEQLNVTFSIDSAVDTLQYFWIIPESLMAFDTISVDSTSVTFSSVSDYDGADTLAVYSLAECAFSDTLMIPFTLVSSDLVPQFEDRIECEGRAFTIEYNYTPGSSYEWFFEPGMTIGDTGDGTPFQVVYEDAGNYSYSVIVSTNDGCVTEGGPYLVDIYELPDAPEIRCNDLEEQTSLTLSWDEIPGLEYSVSVDSPSGVSGVLNGSEYEINNLDPGTEVTFTVTVMNNGPEECRVNSTTITCSTAPFVLPEAPEISCNDLEDPTLVSISWIEVPGLEYAVTVDSPAGVTGTIVGTEYLIENLQPGTEVELTVTVMNDGPEGCNSNATSITCTSAPCILPEAPEISCNDLEDPTSLTFSWAETPGIEYSATVDSPAGITGTQSGSEYLVENLEPGTEVVLTVTATNDGPEGCNMNTATISCTTAPCNLPEIDPGNFQDRFFCQNDPSVNSIQFNVALPPGFSGIFFGQGVNTAGFVDLTDPAFSMPGEYPVVFSYEEDNSGCTDEIEIIITIQPEISIEIGGSFSLCPGEADSVVTEVSGGDGGPYNYLWSNGSTSSEIEIPVETDQPAGVYTVTLTVTDNSTECIEERIIEYTILDTLPIITEVLTSCNNNGTEQDLTDDYYDVFVNAALDQSSGAGRFSVYADGQELAVLDYNTGGNFVLPLSIYPIVLVFTDLDDHKCSNEVEVGPFAPCEPECDIQTSSILICDDNDTSDPSDDFYTVRIVAFVTNPGASNLFVVEVDGEVKGEYPYGDPAEIILDANQSYDILTYDKDKTECSTTSIVTLEPCSFDRYECDELAFYGLPLYGPIEDAVMSEKEDQTAAQFFELNSGEKISSISVYGARENLKQVCESDSSLFELSYYEDASGLPGMVMETFTMYARADSVGQWVDPSDGNEKIVVEYLFDPEFVLSGITSGWFSISVLDEGCPFTWLSGNNAPAFGGAIADPLFNWSSRASFNYCLYYDPTSLEEEVFQDLEIYPNPASAFVHVRNAREISKIDILDITGRKLRHIQKPSENMDLDIGEMPEGLMLFVLTDKKGISRTYKVVKSH
ncbi:MAG: hypothetical protein KJO50_08955, partial [Bacteroidia bacterium]|nr:hypothetical protein [Bacteroidia bacterium]